MIDSEQVCEGKMKSADISEGEKDPEILYLLELFLCIP